MTISFHLSLFLFVINQLYTDLRYSLEIDPTNLKHRPLSLKKVSCAFGICISLSHVGLYVPLGLRDMIMYAGCMR